MAKLTNGALDAIIHDAVSCGDLIRDRTLQTTLEEAFPELRKTRYGWGVGAWDWPMVERSLMRLRSRGLIKGSTSHGRLGDWTPVNPLDELAKIL
jgi:hypothetical protein